MMWDGAAWSWWFPLMMLVVAAVVVAVVVALVIGVHQDRASSDRAASTLAERFARGEISAAEYREGTATLRATHPRSTWTRVAVVVAVIAVAALLVAAIFTAAGPRAGTRYGVGWMHPVQSRVDPESCRTPSSSGQPVTVELADMGAMMRGRSGRDGRPWMRGPMSATARPASVDAGEVSLNAANAGVLVHELMVLPLAAGGRDGARDLGEDWTVSEEGALGEATSNCRVSGLAEDEIAPGGTGSLSLDLAPGRYELLCNLPGHYAMGMHTSLAVK